MQNSKQIPETRRCKPAKLYEKSSFVDIYEVLQSLRNGEVFCDIKLETDDKKIIFAHKVVLASASQYFHAMFTKFLEGNLDLVVIRQIDSTALLLLVNFIYSGKIMVTEETVQVLLPGANLLQLEEVKEACCDFLQTQLCPANCIDINAIANLYNCTELLTSSEQYIQQHYSEVVGSEDFLSLSSAQVIKLISSDKLKVSSEEKVFESVIRWVKHELGSRKCFLPHLLEYARLPLTSKNYIIDKVVEEPLLKNCFKCKDYISEALNFHILKAAELIPQNIRHQPRYGDKVILVDGGMDTNVSKGIEWYDSKTDRWQYAPEMFTTREGAGLAVVKENLVFAVGGVDKNHVETLRSVAVLDVTSESSYWIQTVDMIVKREYPVVGVINDYLYVVGGFNTDDGDLNSAELFDYNTQEWSMISSLPFIRCSFGAGVLNNLLYVVGGYDQSLRDLDTVECYHPSFDTWKPVAKMSVCRSDVGVGVLDGVLYAVGGYDGLNYLSSVETYRPSTGVWTSITDMHLPRRHPGVVALDGLLYVVGGLDDSHFLYSSEFYNPQTNSWTMVTTSMNDERIHAVVQAINRPRHFTTC
ncbi:kelch-like protein 2 [Metopolophium dirhodum]|uniref:kelch-like protein 2 n=1 Tax=Metopolophium dirhodum TaxID=44670 RepID=UPI0029907CC9|nr:kelch-like protein 2 [Metopolophium dirhodum]